MAKKIQLTIKTDYLKEWGEWEGVREIVQNGKDAETEFAAKFEVSWRDNTLYIENEGCIIPTDALLLGFSSKSERGDTIGKFGEGLKLGILALVRNGNTVKIRSGDEVWVPSIEKSDIFSSDVLTFRIESGRLYKNRVRIEIGGISKEKWEKYSDNFLFLKKENPINVYALSGDILIDPKERGRLYVKGIYVCNDNEIEYGYNFKTGIEIDRNRRMLNHYDQEYNIYQLWQTAVGYRESLVPAFIKMLENESKDLAGIKPYNASYAVPEIVANKIIENFRSEYGIESIPVSNPALVAELSHFGIRAILCSQRKTAILNTKIPKYEDIKARLKDEIVKIYSIESLLPEEISNFTGAIELLEMSGVEFDKSTISVCDFRDSAILGMYKKKGEIFISKNRVFCGFEETLETLIHEISHTAGGDGSHEHVNEMASNWIKVARILKKR